MSKLVGQLETKHKLKTLTDQNLGEECLFFTKKIIWTTYSQQPLGKVNNDLEFILNWRSYDANATMFWISLCGTQKKAKEYEYTIKIENSADNKAGRRKYILIATGECLSSELSHEDVKMKPTAVMIFSKDILEKAAEGHDEKNLEWRLVIEKK